MVRIFELQNMSKNDLDKIMKRAQEDIDALKPSVEEIIENVRRRGDQALVEYTKRWDEQNYELSRLRVSAEEIEEAYTKISPLVLERIREQIELSRRFHEFQKSRIPNWQEELENGILVGEKWTAIEEVGLYVPGGKNPFPTVQQILAVAAKAAGCRRIVSCISPRGNGYEVLVAAKECGVDEIYRLGGAQAIAALAYGTETIAPVQLVAGPGSPYVTAAKILCQAKIAIDMPAGPSEAIILADGSTAPGSDLSTKAGYCAADILARAEHGPDSAGLLVTDSFELADLCRLQIEKQQRNLSRKNYIKDALENYSAIIVTKTLAQAVEFTNEYAPEHLEILTENPSCIFASIKNAGSVFLGYYNPVASGDYATGINHVLPACGWARRSSPVGVWTFMKRVQYSQLSKDGLSRLRPIVDTIATIEGLDAHRQSVEIRFEAGLV